MQESTELRRMSAVVIIALGLIAATLAVLTTAPASATNHVTNGLIAYSGGWGGATHSDFDIYVANPDGAGDAIVVRDGSTFALSPSWGPDGNRFAYVRGLTGADAGVWVANADGTGQTKIVSMQYAAAPDWSADGSKIVFWVNWTQNPGNGGIWSVEPDGSNLTHVTGDGAYDDPTLSPDGTKIAYHGPVPDGWGLYVANADGTGRTRIVDDSVLEWSGFNGVDWSPDGSSIVFAGHTGTIPGPGGCSGTNQLPTDLYRVSPDGSGLTKLTDTSTWNGPHETSPRYSPDGTKLVYTSYRIDCVNNAGVFGKRQVWVRNSDGSGPPVQISNFERPQDNAGGTVGWQPCTAATTYRCAFVAPGIPTDITSEPSDGAAFVAWNPPADDGGAPLLGYEVSASPGGAIATTDGHSVNVEFTGLNNGTTYTFFVKAVNGIGPGGASASSAPITPRPGAAPSGPAHLDGLVAYNLSSGIRMVRPDGFGDTSIGRSGFWPDWAPDGNSILYVNGSRMYTSDPDGSNQRLVSNHPDAYASGARWSPDGTKILHWRWLQGMSILDPATFIPTKINDVETAMNGAWSPDGTEIAYTAGLPDGWGVYVMNADGTNRRMVLGTVDSFGPLPRNTWTGDEGLDWSPDGQWIVVAVDGPNIDPPLGLQCLSTQQNQDLWMVRPDGTGARKLINSTSWYGPHETNPRFTPDGSAVLFSARTTDCVGSQTVQNPHQVFAVNLTGIGTIQYTGYTGFGAVARPAMQPCGPDTERCGRLAPPPMCAGLVATIDGDDQANVLEGTPGDDVIWGGDGADEIRGNGGDDIICAGPGDDIVIGGGGNDTLYGEAGDDLLKGLRGNDTMYGGDGDDRIQGQAGNDVLRGDAGKDKLWGGIGTDDLDGGPGNDQLHGDPDADTIDGGDGTDRIWGDAGNDVLSGDGNSDFLYGGIGVDLMYGGEGNDRLFGGVGDDELYGNAGRDQLRGQDGDDLVDGGPDRDFCSVETVSLNCEVPL